MTVKKSYNRYFIIFQEEDKGYGMAIDKQPTGYTKIETRNGRCKITSYVQNLVKEKGPYVSCLMDSTQNPAVLARLGEINVDDTGRGETWWEFGEDDVAETGLPFDRFNVSAVLVEGDRIRAPLAGYIGKDKTPWKDKLNYAPRNIEKEKTKYKDVEDIKDDEEEDGLNEEAKKFKEYEEKINKEENEKAEKKSNENIKEEKKSVENKQDENKSGENKQDNKGENKGNANPNAKSENKGNANPNAKSDNKPENKGNSNPNANQENKGNANPNPNANPNANPKPNANANKAPSPNNKANPNYYNNDMEVDEVPGYVNDSIKGSMTRAIDDESTTNVFHNMLGNYEEVKIFSDEAENTRWWKIPHDDDMTMGDDKYYPYFCAVNHLKMTYPYINYVKYFRSKGHYYFGLKYNPDGDIKYIMYGIEGRNVSQEQPYMGMTGFIKWMKMPESSSGLWIMYYNPHTGCIMIPKKK